MSVVLVVAVLLAGGLGTLTALRVQQAALQRRAESVAEQVGDAIALEVGNDVSALLGLALTLGDELPGISAQRHTFLLDRLREAGALESVTVSGLIQPVADGELDGWLTTIDPSVAAALDLRLGDDEGHLVLTHVWPGWVGQAALGLDVTTQPEIADAARAAALGGRATITPPFVRIQDPPDRASVAAYVPVLDETGRANGAASAVIDGRELLTVVDPGLQGAALRLWDVENAAAIARSPGFDPAATVLAAHRITVVDRDWELEVAADRGLLTPAERLLPWIVLVASLALAAAGTALVVRERRARSEALALVEVRTRELEAATEELTRTNAQLRAADRVKDQLLASVSHDLRSPLTVIQGFVDLLLEGRADGQDTMVLLARVRHQSELLARLVEDLLTAAQLDHDQLHVAARIVDLDAAVAGVIDTLAIGRLVSAPSGVRVRVDPDHLERILTNLLVNASKHGEPPFEVAVSMRSGTDVEVAVRDHGPGIAPEQRDEVFVAFAQLGEPRRGGVGLGLSIARRLAEANGGSLRYEDAPGGGACFVLVLPCAADEPATPDAPAPADESISAR